MKEFKNVFFNETNKKFIVTFSYSSQMVLDIKYSIPANKRSYNVEKKQWIIDVSAAKELLTFCVNKRFNIGDSAKRIFVEFEEKSTVQRQVIEMPDLNVELPLKRTLFPYQSKGVAYNLINREVLIGDTQGLGKTAQAIASIIGAGDKAFPCLIVCPAHLKYNWIQEINQWTNKRAQIMDENMMKYASMHFTEPYTHFAIVNYDSLPKYFANDMKRSELTNKVVNVELNGLEKYFNSIILDEIHLASNPKTQRFKILDKIRETKPMTLRLALSGTPIKNKVSEIIYVLRLIDALKKFGGQKGFTDKYLQFKRKSSGFGIEEIPKNIEELQYELKQKCYYRREKHEVLKDLPDKFRQVIKLDINNRREYNHAIEDFATYLKDVKKKSLDEVDKSMRAEMLTKMMQLIQISARGKMKEISNWIQDTIDSGEKIVIFAHHREMIEYIKNMFPDFVQIIGGMKAEEKDKSVKRFQTDDTCMGIICSISAASTGLTLTASSKLCFVELPWTSEKTDQCEDRTHRIGQKNSVNIYYFLGNNTIDEKMYEIIQSKRAIMQSVTGANEQVETATMNQLIQSIFKFD